MTSSAADWLRAWDSGGVHRTGTAEDHASAAWLVREVEALGATATLETFTLARVDPVACRIEGADFRIEAVPVFDSPPTPHDGVTGDIRVVPLSPWAVYTRDYRTLRRTSGHDGLVIVCTGAQPGLGLLNAEHFNEPYGAPAVHVADAPPGPVTRLINHYRVTRAEAPNVVVTLPGRDRSRPPVVVMTPRSSWWHSTSERGGGLVCWLETLRALIAAPPLCDVVMTANSGHELGHLGLDAFLARRPGWDAAGAAVWVHYGANIGATGGALSIQSADEPLRRAMHQALVRAGAPPVTLAPVTQVPNGETRDIHRGGGRYVTLVGSNPLFHLPSDRWPDAVDVPAIERIAAGAAAMVRSLTGGGLDHAERSG
jgi:hypothetical protein